MCFLLAAGQGANTQKKGNIKDIVKQTSSGTKQSSEAEDQVVMETKLKIIEILQVSVSVLKHLNSRGNCFNCKQTSWMVKLQFYG